MTIDDTDVRLSHAEFLELTRSILAFAVVIMRGPLQHLTEEHSDALVSFLANAHQLNNAAITIMSHPAYSSQEMVN